MFPEFHCRFHPSYRVGPGYYCPKCESSLPPEKKEMNGWTEIEKLPIGTISDDSNDHPKFQHGIGLAGFGIPPDGFTPDIGDFYWTKEREYKAWMGGPIPEGAKFPVSERKKK